MDGFLKFLGAAITLGIFTCIALTSANKDSVPVVAAGQSLTISTNNRVIDSKVKSSSGETIWMSGETDTNVTYNLSTGKINISAGGYIQNFTALKGITKITADMVSGSLGVYYGYEMPSGLEIPQYTTNYNLTATTKSFNFSGNYPSYFRLVANSASVLRSIKIEYSNIVYVDLHEESIDQGLENLYIDPNKINKYANVAFSNHPEDTYRASARSLKITFGNTQNDFFVLNPKRDADANNIISIPNLSDATLTLKAKFVNLAEGMSIQLVDKSWNMSSWYPMSVSNSEEEYWYTYSINFSSKKNFNFNEIIRINIKPGSVDPNNRARGYALIDEINFTHHNPDKLTTYESTSDGLENLPHDINFENTNSSLSLSTYGTSSKTSLLAKPNPNKNSMPEFNWGWGTTFSLEGTGLDLSKGILSFNYQTHLVANSDKVIIYVLKSWDDKKKGLEKVFYKEEILGRKINDSWYACSVDLSQTGLPSGDFISLGIGFNIDNSKKEEAYFILDNIFISDEPRENYTQGWENMTRDLEWEKCDATYDRGIVASDTSINSLRMTFENKTITYPMYAGCILSPQQLGIDEIVDMRIGTLSASVLFSNDITEHTVRLTFVDKNWKAVRYEVQPQAQNNGWYKISFNLASPGKPVTLDSAFDASRIIRIGFSFRGVTDKNKDDAVVWLDDVFFNHEISKGSVSNATLWWTYDTDNVPNNAGVCISENIISNGKGLTATGIKNSVESMNLQVYATKKIWHANFIPGKLINTNGSGSYIGAENIEVLWAKYVYISNSNEISDGGMSKGKRWLPDALVPIKNIIQNGEDYINNGEDQTIWININIPKNIEAGTYKGTAKIILNGEVRDVPMSVNVYNVTMSDKTHSKTLFGCWWEPIQTKYGALWSNNKETIKSNYIKFAQDHKISLDRHSDSKMEPTKFAEYFANNIAFNDKISNYKLMTSDEGKTNKDEYKKYFNALIEKNIELINKGYEVNFFDKLVLKTSDEVTTEKSKDTNESKVDILGRENQAIQQAIAEVKHKLDNYPVLKASFVDLQNITTIDFIRGKDNSKFPVTSFNIDTICPQFGDFNSEAKRNEIFNNFDHVWWYGCMFPFAPSPNYHLDTWAYYGRATSWLQYYYNIEGEYYWTISMYGKYNETLKIFDYSQENWESDPLTVGDCAGDGRLTYPGVRYGINGPITTIRMEQIRSSKQDYEYLYMLEKGLGTYNKKCGTNYQSVQQLLSPYFGLMFDGTTIKKSFTTADMKNCHDGVISYLNRLYN